MIKITKTRRTSKPQALYLSSVLSVLFFACYASATYVVPGAGGYWTLNGKHLEYIEANGDVRIFSYDSTAGGSKADLEIYRARGTETTPLKVEPGDTVGAHRFRSYDGDEFHTTATISANVTGATSDNNIPTALLFRVSDLSHTGATSYERMRITSQGDVGIGDSTPDASLRLDVEGQVGATEYCDENGANCTSITAVGATSIDDLSDGKSDEVDDLFLGTNAGALSTGFANTGVGIGTLAATTTGNENTAFGNTAMPVNTTGGSNTAMGQGVLLNNVDGSFNVAIGEDALRNNVSGAENSAIGKSTLENVTGSGNTALGFEAGDNIGAGSYNVAVGYKSEVPTATADNQLSIGNIIYGTGVDGTGATISTGSIGIGTTTPTTGYRLDVAGSLRVDGSGATCLIGDATGTVSCTSDRRLKEHIVPIESSLQKLKQIDGVYFAWKDPSKADRNNIGVIAQDVEEVFPELVSVDNGSGYKTVQYGGLVAPIIEAIKVLSQSVDELFERYVSQQKEIDALRADIETLKRQIK